MYVYPRSRECISGSHGWLNIRDYEEIDRCKESNQTKKIIQGSVPFVLLRASPMRNSPGSSSILFIFHFEVRATTG